MFGIYSASENVAETTFFGIFSLQHRGQEGCGIAVYNEETGGIDSYKRIGLVTEVFNQSILDGLKGKCAIGHVRYRSNEDKSEANTQPLVSKYLQGEFAIAHEGNFVNKEALRQEMEKKGGIFQTDTDTEILCYLLARYAHLPMHESIKGAMGDLEGAYTIVAIHQGKLYAVRDPYGNRPLCLGKLEDGYVVASETCALDTVGADFVRDVRPGEILVVDENGLHSYDSGLADGHPPAHCIFEYVYLARPDSTIDGVNVNKSRRRMGENLAIETGPLDVDLVMSVPDSGTTSAIGYADGCGQIFSQGILKNRYAGRTFIQPTQSMRERTVSLKLNPIRDEIEGRKIAVVDDSVVRGTTSKRLVERLRDRGAEEVHFLVSCPPVLYPCYYGVDTAHRDKLIAVNRTVEEVRDYMGADSLHYLSLDGLFKAIGDPSHYCTACLNGNYRIGCPKGAEEDR